MTDSIILLLNRWVVVTRLESLFSSSNTSCYQLVQRQEQPAWVDTPNQECRKVIWMISRSHGERHGWSPAGLGPGMVRITGFVV